MDFLFEDQPDLCVVSNGAECLKISKKFFLHHASKDLLERLRKEVSVCLFLFIAASLLNYCSFAYLYLIQNAQLYMVLILARTTRSMLLKNW